MTIPPTISLSSIDRSDRGRTEYYGTEERAENILQVGLIEPIVLVQRPDGSFKLEAGGQRCKSLDLLLENGDWDGVLHHGATCDPKRPGFVVRGHEDDDELKSLLVELAENKFRHDVPWQDESRLLVKLYRQSLKFAALRGDEAPDLRIAAIGLGCGYNDLRAALFIHDELVAHPGKFKDVTTVRNAHKLLIEESARAVEAEMTRRLKEIKPEVQPTEGDKQIIRDLLEMGLEEQPVAPRIIPITSILRFGSGLEFMEAAEDLSFDHIITDPDYGISTDLLESNSANAAIGVAQTSVEETLAQFPSFFYHAFRICRGTLIFWLDIEHWNYLHKLAVSYGFSVQRWPITWHKTDHNSNAVGMFNTTKDEEWAMICRKPGVPLLRVDKSVWSMPKGDAVKTFGHPFAKPIPVWQRLMQLVASKGQTHLDPFGGSCSSVVAALRYGLAPTGCEIQEVHYNRGLNNLQMEFRRELGDSVSFT